jgi:hypothetical protein
VPTDCSRQRRLADPCLAPDQQQRAAAAHRSVDQTFAALQFRDPPDQPRRAWWCTRHGAAIVARLRGAGHLNPMLSSRRQQNLGKLADTLILEHTCQCM